MNESYYRFVVNPIGEPVRSTDPEGKDDQPLGGGVVNVSLLARQVLLPEHYEIYVQFDRNSPEWNALNRYVQQCVQHQFFAAAYEDLSLAEFDFYCRIGDLQRINNSRFRVWGEMHADRFDADQRRAWLVTEFLWWVDDSEYWPRLETLAAECSCEVHVLYEEPHVDQKWPAELVESGVKLTDENAVFGEDHGRPERQVEFRCNVYGCSEQTVRRRIEELAASTEDVWRLSGVAVC